MFNSFTQFKPYVVKDVAIEKDHILETIHKQFYFGKGPNTNVGLKSDKEISFEFCDFVRIVQALSKVEIIHSVSGSELDRKVWPLGKIPILFRHDVDGDLDTALDIAKVEAEYGFKGTFYILPAALYYSNWYTPKSADERKYAGECIERYEKMTEIYLEIQAMGHEVGLHYFPYGSYNELLMDGVDHIMQEAAWLRKAGLNIRGGVGHSSSVAQGADMAEIFSEFVDRAINVNCRNINPAPLFQFKGLELPRHKMSLGDVPLEYVHEFTPKGNGYWAIRENGNVLYAAAANQAATRQDFCSIGQMLQEIKNRIGGGGYDLDAITIMIHPEHMRSRITPVRADEQELRKLVYEGSAKILATCPTERPKNAPCVVRYVSDQDQEIEVAHFTNSLGFLDYEPEYEKELDRSLVLFIGTDLIECSHLQITQNLPGWLKKIYWHEDRRRISVRNFSSDHLPGSRLCDLLLLQIAKKSPNVIIIEWSRRFLDSHGEDQIRDIARVVSTAKCPIIPIAFCRAGSQFDEEILRDLFGLENLPVFDSVNAPLILSNFTNRLKTGYLDSQNCLDMAREIKDTLKHNTVFL
jgi:hypothetical protein